MGDDRPVVGGRFWQGVVNALMITLVVGFLVWRYVL